MTPTLPQVSPRMYDHDSCQSHSNPPTQGNQLSGCSKIGRPISVVKNALVVVFIMLTTAHAGSRDSAKRRKLELLHAGAPVPVSCGVQTNPGSEVYWNGKRFVIVGCIGSTAVVKDDAGKPRLVEVDELTTEPVVPEDHRKVKLYSVVRLFSDPTDYRVQGIDTGKLWCSDKYRLSLADPHTTNVPNPDWSVKLDDIEFVKTKPGFDGSWYRVCKKCRGPSQHCNKCKKKAKAPGILCKFREISRRRF